MKLSISRIAIFLCICSTCIAQAPPPNSASDLQNPGRIYGYPSWPIARPQDVASADAILAAMHDIISGPKEKVRDWNRFRSLFLPGAQLTDVHDRKIGAVASMLNIERYIGIVAPNLTKADLFENSIQNRKQEFGSLVHVWSTYESRREKADVKPRARFIESAELFNDGERYWIVNIYTNYEDREHSIPEKYLSAAASARIP
jgi:hypothetical protein